MNVTEATKLLFVAGFTSEVNPFIRDERGQLLLRFDAVALRATTANRYTVDLCWKGQAVYSFYDTALEHVIPKLRFNGSLPIDIS